MKVLVNATSIGSDCLTGIERFSLRMSQELYRLDQNIKVVSTEEIPDVPSVIKPGLLITGRRLLARNEYLLRAVWDQTFFRYEVMKSKPDIVFFPIQDGMFYPPVKQVVTVHDLHHLYFKESLPECRREIHTFRTDLYRRKMPHILSRSAAVIAVSESTKMDLVNSFNISPDKIHVLYNGYDEARFRLIPEPDCVLQRYGLHQGEYFLFVGSILRHKNLKRLVEAFGQLDCETSLVIAGACKDSGYLHELMRTARSLRVPQDKLHYLEYVPDEYLPYLYNGAVAFVLPSLHEGFGIPLIEAMACGTPVITSNTSAMPEVAGEAALYVDPNSVESIANAMRKVVTSQRSGADLRKLGFERVKQFRWSTSANGLYKICQDICDQ